MNKPINTTILIKPQKSKEFDSSLYLPNFYAYVFDWLKHVKIRIIFKLCIFEMNILSISESIYESICDMNPLLHTRVINPWNFPFSFVVGVFNSLSSR